MAGTTWRATPTIPRFERPSWNGVTSWETHFAWPVASNHGITDVLPGVTLDLHALGESTLTVEMDTGRTVGALESLSRSTMHCRPTWGS